MSRLDGTQHRAATKGETRSRDNKQCRRKQRGGERKEAARLRGSAGLQWKRAESFHQSEHMPCFSSHFAIWPDWNTTRGQFSPFLPGPLARWACSLFWDHCLDCLVVCEILKTSPSVTKNHRHHVQSHFNPPLFFFSKSSPPRGAAAA